MENSYSHESTLEIVESLQGLQKVADKIDSPDQKIEHVLRVCNFLHAHELLKKQFMVDSLQAFSHSINQPSTQLTLFQRGLIFVGRLDSFNYLQDYDIPVDSLTLSFSQPHVLDIDPEDSNTFQPLKLLVPILAIQSCIEAS